MDIVRFAKVQWDRILGWACIAAGGLALLLSYLGIRKTAFVADQLSYLASGGLGGLWLLGVGATLLVLANLSDEWRKLDEVKDLLRLVLERDGTAPVDDDLASRNGGSKRTTASEVASPAEPAPGGADRRAIAVLGLATLVGSAALLWYGSATTADATGAGAALEDATIGVVGLVVLSVGAVVLLARARRGLRAHADGAFSTARLAAAVGDRFPSPALAGADVVPALVRLPGSSWNHTAGCPIVLHQGGGRTVRSARSGAPCPLCHPGLRAR